MKAMVMPHNLVLRDVEKLEDRVKAAKYAIHATYSVKLFDGTTSHYTTTRAVWFPKALIWPGSAPGSLHVPAWLVEEKETQLARSLGASYLEIRHYESD